MPLPPPHLQQLLMPMHDLFYSYAEDSVAAVPKLHQLDLLEMNGERIKIIDTTAAVWNKVALRLFFEKHEIARIARDYPQQNGLACQQMYTEWLDGSHREPVSWNTLIKAFREAELLELANKLKIMFNQDMCQDSANQCKLW